MKLFKFNVVVSLFLISCSAFADPKILPLPSSVSVQNDEWSCGVYSGAVLMQYNGESHVSYEEVKSSCPKSIDFPGMNLMVINIPAIVVGPNPYNLAEHLTSFRKTGQIYKVFSNQKWEDVIYEIDRNRPVMALLNLGDEEKFDLSVIPPFFKAMVPGLVSGFPFVKAKGIVVTEADIPAKLMAPKLHYVVINGYDRDPGKTPGVDDLVIYYRETDGTEHYASQAEMDRKWLWKNNADFLGRILESEGVTGGILVKTRLDRATLEARGLSKPKHGHRHDGAGSGSGSGFSGSARK